jgi:hypothetical protein
MDICDNSIVPPLEYALKLDFSSLSLKVIDRSNTVYGQVQEDLAKDTPEPLEMPAVLLFYVDA